MSVSIRQAASQVFVLFLHKFLYFFVIFVAVLAFLEMKGETIDSGLILYMLLLVIVSLMLAMFGLFCCQLAFNLIGKLSQQEEFYNNPPIYIVGPLYLALLYVSFHFGASIVKMLMMNAH